MICCGHPTTAHVSGISTTNASRRTTYQLHLLREVTTKSGRSANGYKKRAIRRLAGIWYHAGRKHLPIVQLKRVA